MRRYKNRLDLEEDSLLFGLLLVRKLNVMKSLMVFNIISNQQFHFRNKIKSNKYQV